MQNAMLLFISSEGEIDRIATGDLDSMLIPESPYYDEILGTDPEDEWIRKTIVQDLSRVGARFAEHAHGQFVIALLD